MPASGEPRAETGFRHTLSSLFAIIAVVGTLATFCFPSIVGTAHGDGPAAEKLQDASPDSLPLDDEYPAAKMQQHVGQPQQNKNVAEAYHIHVA
jgi:hypothetical protein